METEFGRGYVGRRPTKWRGENREEVKKRIERWKASVDKAQRMRKNMYCMPIGCWARRPKLEASGAEDVGAAFSMRAQVR